MCFRGVNRCLRYCLDLYVGVAQVMQRLGEQGLKECGEVGVLLWRYVIGFSGCQCQPVNTWCKQPRQQAALAVIKALHQRGERTGQVFKALRAGTERAEYIDQYDLAVEAAKVVTIEGAHDMLLVVTKACRQSSVNTFTRQLGQSCRISIGNGWQRKELQDWRSFKIPR